MLALLGLLLAAVPPANLLTNGDFEADVAGWTADAELRRDGSFTVAGDERRGGLVAVIENRSGATTVAATQELTVEPGKLYVLTGWSRSTALQELAGVALHALAADGRIVQRRWVHQIPSWGISGWTEFRAEYLPPAGTATLQVRLSVYQRGKVWLDDLRLVATTPARRADPWGERVTDFGLGVTRLPTARPVWQMAAADLDGDGTTELVLGDIDGVLRCQEPDGAVRWERDLGGLALDLATGDLDGDGRPEVLAATADQGRWLRALDAAGEELWRLPADGPTWRHVAAGDLDGDRRAEVLVTGGNQLVTVSPQGKVLWQRDFGGPRMRCAGVGDVDGDGRPDVACSLKAQSLFAAAFAADGKPLWQFKPVGGPGLPAEDIAVADLDGDGRAEVLLGCEQGRVACLAEGELRWLAERERAKLWPRHRDATENLSPARCELAVGDFLPERPGLETLVALVDGLWLLDRDGRFVWEAQSGLPLLDLVTAAGGELYAPSSGFRDAAVYRLEPVRGRGNPLAEAALPNPIYDTLDGLHQAAADRRREPGGPDGKFHVVYANLPWPGNPDLMDRLRQTDATLRGLENDRLEFLFMLWPKDLPVELNRGQMIERDQILQVVRFLEELGRPFLFFVDHGCAPNLSLETCAETLRLAPRTCRGFYVAENTERYPSAKWDEFAAWATRLMDLCLAAGGDRKVVFKEMYDAWAALPADPQVKATLLQPKYRDVLVTIYATNNPHAPELQLGGMAGLHRAGLTSGWGISTQHWNWSWAAHGLDCNFPNLCPADVLLRMELAAACLGGRWFHVEGGQTYLTRDGSGLDPAAVRHRDLVYELIRKGVLRPVPPADNLSFSPLAVVRAHHPAVDQARRDNRNLGSPLSRPPELLEGLLGVREAVLTTAPDYLPSYAYGVRRYTDTMCAATPFGFLEVLPAQPGTEGYLAGRPQLRTDGLELLEGDGRVAAERAREPVLTRLREAAATLPFRADGTACYVHRLGDRWRVWLLDPGYLDPAGVTTRLELRLPGDRFEVHDALHGQALPVEGRTAQVDVAAGAFRVLDVVAR